jgi:hypothetical protein
VAALGRRGGVGEVGDVSPIECSRQVVAGLRLWRRRFAGVEDAGAAAPAMWRQVCAFCSSKAARLVGEHCSVRALWCSLLRRWCW